MKSEIAPANRIGTWFGSGQRLSYIFIACVVAACGGRFAGDSTAGDDASDADASVTLDGGAPVALDATLPENDADLPSSDASSDIISVSEIDAISDVIPTDDAPSCPAAWMGELCSHGRYYYSCPGDHVCLEPTNDDTCGAGYTDCTSPCTENEFGAWCAPNTPPPFTTCRLVDASAGGVPYCCPCD